MERIYRYITWLAMAAMPAAAAINFGDAAYDALLTRVPVELAIAGGFATGIGFEALGFLAGHRAVAFYSQDDPRWKLTAVVMFVYVAIGMGEMITIPFARFVPLLAGMVYVLAGLQNQAEKEQVEQADKTAWELEQAAKDKELERELKRQKQADLTAVKLAKLETKKVAPAKVSQVISQNGSQRSQKKPAESVKHYECVCGRVFEGSRSYNAHRRHCEIPADEPAKIFAANGVAK